MYQDELSSDYSEESASCGEVCEPSHSTIGKGGKADSMALELSEDKTSAVPRKGSKGGLKNKNSTIKDMFKRDMKDMGASLTSADRVLIKVSKLNQGEAFVVDVSDAPPHLFRNLDRKAVLVDIVRFARSNRLIKKEFLSFCSKFQKHLKNKTINDKEQSAKPSGDSDKGHNCSCIIKGPLVKFVEMTKSTFVVDGKAVLDKMPMLKNGFCKKLTFQHYINLYNKVNKLIHPESNQRRLFDSILNTCFGGKTAADKLYIKLPVELKEKEIDLDRVHFPKMKSLLQRISSTNPERPTKTTVNVYEAILSGQCTKMEYLDALPFITKSCKRELLTYFNPPEDGAKLKIPMDLAVTTKMVPRPLNTVELAYITKPDFDPTCYPAFFANFLTTLNLDTSADLKPLHTLGVEDNASRLMGNLKDPTLVEKMDLELTYIKNLCKKM